MDTLIRIRERTLEITVIGVILFSIAFMPDGLKNIFAIYKMTTESLPLVYTYNYYFIFLEIIVIVAGLYLYQYSETVKFIPVLFCIFLINCFRYLLGLSNIFSLHSYEMFLMLLTSICICSIIFYICKSIDELESVFNGLIVLMFCSQVLMYALGHLSRDGRVGAMSLGVGATAQIYSTFIVWSLFAANNAKRRVFPVTLASLGILLTGSRANILFVLSFCIVFFMSLMKNAKKNGTSNRLYMLFLIGIVGVAVLVINSTYFDAFNRIVGLFIGDIYDNITNADSTIGRMLSIKAGFAIWKDNPLGIANSIFEIEQLTYLNCRMEYPHSTLLSYILLWSPIISIPLFLRMVYQGIELFRKKDSSFILVMMICIQFVVYGCPILYVPVYTWYFMLISYLKLKLKNLGDK